MSFAIQLGIFAAAAVVIALVMKLFDRKPWHCFFDGDLLIVAIPWWVLVLAADGYDPCEHKLWTGIYILRRIPGTEHLQPSYQRQLFETKFKHVLREAFL